MLIAITLLLSAAEISDTPWPLAERAFERGCPEAEQEALIGCAYRLMARSDERIKRTLCAAKRVTCGDRFAAFVKRRRATIRQVLDVEGTVNSQLSAAWTGLEQTLRFERFLAGAKPSR